MSLGKEDMRQSVLEVHVEEAITNGTWLAASPLERPDLLMAMSRTALGLDPNCDITELAPATQEDLLFVMSGMRDTLQRREQALNMTLPPEPEVAGYFAK